MRRLSGPIVSLVLALAWPLPAAAQQPAVRGHLVIVGGGPRPADVTARYVELAGGAGRAHVVVVPNASGDVETDAGRKAAREAGEELVADFEKMGVDARSVLLSHAQAMDPASARLLDGATAIWFTGGDQSRLTAALKGTPVEAKMHELYRSGAVIGGTSAGAAVMSAVMLTGNELHPGGEDRPDSTLSYATIAREDIETVPGFGFVENAVVDQHFLRRKRMNRLLSVVLEHPTLLGVGIDESTAVEVDPDGSWHVLGNSAALVFDARHARVVTAKANRLGAAPITLSILPAGSTFDPATGRATLPTSLVGER